MGAAKTKIQHFSLAVDSIVIPTPAQHFFSISSLQIHNLKPQFPFTFQTVPHHSLSGSLDLSFRKSTSLFSSSFLLMLVTPRRPTFKIFTVSRTKTPFFDNKKKRRRRRRGEEFSNPFNGTWGPEYKQFWLSLRDERVKEKGRVRDVAEEEKWGTGEGSANGRKDGFVYIFWWVWGTGGWKGEGESEGRLRNEWWSKFF